MKLYAQFLAGFLVFTGLAAGVEFEQTPTELGKIRRVYVEQLGGGRTSDQMRDMIIAALENAKIFVVTENPDKADAVLRGSSDDKIYTDEHNTSDSVGIRANKSNSSSSRSYNDQGSSASDAGGVGITDSETSHIKERKHETSASIRLVSADGDVLWSATQESAGGKFRGAMADVADKIVRQLVEDVRKARMIDARNGRAIDVPNGRAVDVPNGRASKDNP